MAIGDQLLTVDPDRVAAKLATHPWIASARVRRELPSVLAIEVTERRAVASALMGALYLLDESGRPFKRATFDEADGLPVITGVTREQYAALRPASEAVFREALALLARLRRRAPAARSCRKFTSIRGRASRWCCSTAPARSASGAAATEEKLARLDQILAALGPRGPAALATVYLDGALADRVTVRLAVARAAPLDAGTATGRRSRAAPAARCRSAGTRRPLGGRRDRCCVQRQHRERVSRVTGRRFGGSP